jgi:membrane protein DedA with SNARE-associated domain
MASGCIAAVLWGIGVSLRAFFLGPLAIEWTDWAIQLFAGVIVCLLVARVGLWLADRYASKARLSAVPVDGGHP